MAVNTLGNTGGPMDWFHSLPQITRTYALLTVVTAAMISWGISQVMYCLLDWRYVFNRFEIWRLVTHVTILGKFSFPFLIKLIWILTYGTTLESVVYQHHPEDFLYLFIFSTTCFTLISLLVSPYVLGLFKMVATGESMVMVLIYLWSKEFPEEDIKLYGLVKIKGFYLPFAFMGIELLMGSTPIGYAIGIAVAHVWFFLTNLLPRATGQEYLKTPQLVRNLALRMGLGAGPAAAAGPARPGAPPAQPPLFRAFQGRGHRLSS